MTSRRKFILGFGGVVAGASLLGAAGPASGVAPQPQRVTINGVEYGPEDGLEITTATYDVALGEPPVLVEWSGPMSDGPGERARWGTSFAESAEQLQIRYYGSCLAAGNIYSGKRIVKVCFRYTRGTQDLSGLICSTATSTGTSWNAGTTRGKTVFDSLDPNAPTTKFTYSLTGINPNVY